MWVKLGLSLLLGLNSLHFLDASSPCQSDCGIRVNGSRCFADDVSWYSGNVVAAFNQRVIVAANIGKWKKQRGLPIFDPTRVEALLKAIANLNQGPISDGREEDFFRLIINRTTEFEYDYVDKPPNFNCSFFYQCENGYDTDCKDSCSTNDSDLSCWRDDINVYTNSLLTSLNQLAILEAHLAVSLVREKKPAVDEARVGVRIDSAKKLNKGPLPDEYIEDVFERIFNLTLEYARRVVPAVAEVAALEGRVGAVEVATGAAMTLPVFECRVSPSCKSNGSKRSILTIHPLLKVIYLIALFAS